MSSLSIHISLTMINKSRKKLFSTAKRQTIAPQILQHADTPALTYQYTFLDVIHAVVILFQHLTRPIQVQVLLTALAPRQVR